MSESGSGVTPTRDLELLDVSGKARLTASNEYGLSLCGGRSNWSARQVCQWAI